MKFLIAVLAPIYLLKLAALVRRRRPLPLSGLAAFLFAWPGVLPGSFEVRRPGQTIDAARMLAAWARFAAGVAAVVLLAVFAPRLSEPFLGLAGIAALLLAIHIGICDLLPWFLRWAGFSVPLLFDRPWVSVSLNDFWSRRWNLAFVEMNRALFLRPLFAALGGRRARFSLFVLSGLLHELGLSFPAGGGWGLPSAYFLLHGLLCAVEDRFRIANRAWTWFWLIAPAPWLFHQPFRHNLIVPFYLRLHALLAGHTYGWYLSTALYGAALGHLLVLCASLQTPVRLNWKSDLVKLTRFNQRIFWLFGFYILLSIVSFACLTWRLHDDFLAGEPAARGLAGFIAIFWSVRVLADFVWYDYRDWPKGNALVLGHALVTTLFASLAVIYSFAALMPPV